VDHGVPADQPVGVGGGTGADHAVHVVHHYKGPSDDGQHLGCAGRQREFIGVDLQQLPLRLADPVGKHSEGTERQANEAGDQTDEHRIHSSTLCSGMRRSARLDLLGQRFN